MPKRRTTVANTVGKARDRDNRDNLYNLYHVPLSPRIPVVYASPYERAIGRKRV